MSRCGAATADALERGWRAHPRGAEATRVGRLHATRRRYQPDPTWPCSFCSGTGMRYDVGDICPWCGGSGINTEDRP